MDFEEIKGNKWMLSTMALLVVVVGLGAFAFMEGLNCPTGSLIKEDSQEVASKTIDFINNNMVQTGEASLKSVNETSGIYKVTTSYQGQDITVYTTRDGKYIMMQGFNTKEVDSQNQNQNTDDQTQSSNFDAPDRETPKVELYVQSFCPYGNQAEGGIESALKLLNDKINYEPHYVIYSDYASRMGKEPTAYCYSEDEKYCSMHGRKELMQNIRERCVFDNYEFETYMDFVTAINEQCSSGNVDECWSGIAEENAINTSEVENCVDSNAESILSEDKSLNEENGVSGSPTLLINGEKKPTTGGTLVINERDFGPGEQRTPDAYKEAICSGFTEEPEVCNQELESSSSGTAEGTC